MFATSLNSIKHTSLCLMNERAQPSYVQSLQTSGSTKIEEELSCTTLLLDILKKKCLVKGVASRFGMQSFRFSFRQVDKSTYLLSTWLRSCRPSLPSLRMSSRSLHRPRLYRPHQMGCRASRSSDQGLIQWGL